MKYTYNGYSRKAKHVIPISQGIVCGFFIFRCGTSSLEEFVKIHSLQTCEEESDGSLGTYVPEMWDFSCKPQA